MRAALLPMTLSLVCSLFFQHPARPKGVQNAEHLTAGENVGTFVALDVPDTLETAPSVHDPVLIRQKGRYYLFCTGMGISVWSSSDMKHWKAQQPVFDKAPGWAAEAVPGFRNHIWAPDISYFNGRFYLFYSVSAFGKNTSCIGLATNTTLDPADPDYRWTDHGKIIQSIPGQTNWNAIDPNLAVDEKGQPYLAFGSFWGGLKIARLSMDRMRVVQQPDELPVIASRKADTSIAGNLPAVDGNPPDAGGNAIEAPFIFKKNGWFYLFASIDYCCKGPKSTYKMIVGRSRKLKGPYVDKSNTPLSRGGGSLVLEGDQHWYGVGHNAVCTFDKKDYLVFHGYDAIDRARPKLRIMELAWTRKGWPEPVLDRK